MIRLRWISSRSNWIAAAALADATSGASTRNALRGPRAATKLERGTMAGRGEPANRCWGAMGYTDRVDDMPPVTGGKSTNCGSGAWPQQRRDSAEAEDSL